MDSQANLPFYTSIIQGDIDVDSHFVDISQNNPIYVSNSPPKVRIVIPKKTKSGNNFTVEEDNLLVLAWLNTGVDVVHNNEQKQETFCEKLAIFLQAQCIWYHIYSHHS